MEGNGEDDNLKEEEMAVLDREGVNEDFKEEVRVAKEEMKDEREVRTPKNDHDEVMRVWNGKFADMARQEDVRDEGEKAGREDQMRERMLEHTTNLQEMNRKKEVFLLCVKII